MLRRGGQRRVRRREVAPIRIPRPLIRRHHSDEIWSAVLILDAVGLALRVDTPRRGLGAHIADSRPPRPWARLDGHRERDVCEIHDIRRRNVVADFCGVAHQSRPIRIAEAPATQAGQRDGHGCCALRLWTEINDGRAFMLDGPWLAQVGDALPAGHLFWLHPARANRRGRTSRRERSVRGHQPNAERSREHGGDSTANANCHEPPSPPPAGLPGHLLEPIHGI